MDGSLSNHTQLSIDAVITATVNTANAICVIDDSVHKNRFARNRILANCTEMNLRSSVVMYCIYSRHLLALRGV